MTGGLSDTEPKLWEIILGHNIFHAIITVCLALSMVWYRQRRYCYPLKGRGSRAILLCCGLFVIMLISSNARGPGWPCVVDLVIFCVGSHCAVAVYVYRVIVLLVRHDIAKEISLGPSTTLHDRSCLHNPRFVPFLKFRRWIFVLVSYGLLIGMIFLGIALSQGDQFECEGMIGLASNLTLIALALPTMLFLSFKLRKFPSDGRKISVEFRCMAFCIIIALAVQIVASQAGLSYVTAYEIGVLILDFIAIALMTTSLLFPVYLSYQFRGKHKRSSSSSLTRASTASALDALLQSEDFREAFLLHLKSEFNAESLVFWQAVNTFKEKGERPADQMIHDMQEIFDAYLVPTAPYLLNTSMDSIEDTRLLFQHAQEAGTGFLAVFDGLLHEVLTLMKSDPLPRFLRTPAGREFAPHSGSTRQSSQHSDHSNKNPSCSNRDASARRHSAIVVDIDLSTRRPSVSAGTPSPTLAGTSSPTVA